MFSMPINIVTIGMAMEESFHTSVKRAVFVDVSPLAMVKSWEGCVCGVFWTIDLKDGPERQSGG
jgi:hypothetical protein